MTRLTGILLGAVLLSSCQNAPPPVEKVPEGHQTGDEAAILAVTDSFMTAITNSDINTLASLQTSDGMTYQWRPTGDGGMGISGRPNSFWTDPSHESKQAFRERYWSPTVMIRGGIAVVWAPYEFWIDGETSHCGVDVFDFVKMDGSWKVSNAAWTVEPDACTELRPEDVSSLRPAD